MILSSPGSQTTYMSEFTTMQTISPVIKLRELDAADIVRWRKLFSELKRPPRRCGMSDTRRSRSRYRKADALGVAEEADERTTLISDGSDDWQITRPPRRASVT